MIELQRHIEILLLSNECVIVPDFGGFVTHYVSARYDEEEQLFLPPLRTLGFNPQLRINDSLLVQSYVEAYDLSYPEALRRIEGEVAELRRRIANEGHYTLEDIGRLTVNAEGNYEFEPCEAGLLTPELYGLSTCLFTPLGVEAVQPAPEPAQEEPTAVADEEAAAEEPQTPSLLELAEEEDDERTIAVKLSWIRNAVAVAAAVVAFFFIATPVANSDLGSPLMSSLQNHVLYRLVPQDTTPAPVPTVTSDDSSEPAPAEEAPAAEQADTLKAEEPAVATEETALQKPYCLVLASRVKRSNAEDYVQQLQRQGHASARLYVRGDLVRVVYGSYATEAEAYQALNKLHTEEAFSEAWVLRQTENS